MRRLNEIQKSRKLSISLYYCFIKIKIESGFGNQCRRAMTKGGGKNTPGSTLVRMPMVGMFGDSDVLKHVAYTGVVPSKYCTIV